MVTKLMTCYAIWIKITKPPKERLKGQVIRKDKKINLKANQVYLFVLVQSPGANRFKALGTTFNNINDLILRCFGFVNRIDGIDMVHPFLNKVMNRMVSLF